MSSYIKKNQEFKQGSNWSFHLEKSQKNRENDATRHKENQFTAAVGKEKKRKEKFFRTKKKLCNP